MPHGEQVAVVTGSSSGIGYETSLIWQEMVSLHMPQ